MFKILHLDIIIYHTNNEPCYDIYSVNSMNKFFNILE